jgi:glucosamine--fructose-6-phosphate aminotransferase (isomerizing)
VQAERLAQALAPLVGRLEQHAPALTATIARGSSEHAAAFARYADSLRLGMPTASLPLSLASVYGRTRCLDRALVLALSQSGASPDSVLATRAAHEGRALCVGLVNEPGSVLGGELDIEIPKGAGPERAIAAATPIGRRI